MGNGANLRLYLAALLREHVAGHRLSTGGMEEILARHPDVAECAVLGVHDDLKRQVPVGFVVLKAGANRDSQELVAELIQMVREQLGAIASFKRAAVVERLPKTRSGKILRGTMRSIADGESYKAPCTIDDPAILPEIEDAVAAMGYGKKWHAPDCLRSSFVFGAGRSSEPWHDCRNSPAVADRNRSSH